MADSLVVELDRLARAVSALRDSAVSDAQRLAYDNVLEEIALSARRVSGGAA